jgi:hypothetical protein
MKERWKRLNEYRGLLEISNFGRVRNFKTKRLRKLTKHTTLKNFKYNYIMGYIRVAPSTYKYRQLSIAGLVAKYFLKIENKKLTHRDGNINNNHADNICLLKDKPRYVIKKGFVGVHKQTVYDYSPKKGRCAYVTYVASKRVKGKRIMFGRSKSKKEAIQMAKVGMKKLGLPYPS